MLLLYVLYISKDDCFGQVFWEFLLGNSLKKSTKNEYYISIVILKQYPRRLKNFSFQINNMLFT